jgi:tetratricopeptide (TPR) repeat protein
MTVRRRVTIYEGIQFRKVNFPYFNTKLAKMRALPIAFPTFLLLGLLSASRNTRLPRDTRQTDPSLIDCAPPPNPQTVRPDENGKYAPIFPGWGHYHYPVHTNNDSAKLFFDQGLSMYYSYHLTEALASFKEAARRDPGCTMAYWGQALSMGPYYNSYFYKMPPAVLPALEKMNQNAASATEKEKDLIAAMNKRYSEDPSDTRRPQLNRAYSEQMAALIKKYPADPDVKALYIDAVMLEHSWDFWETNGTPKPWTPELVAYCAQILKDYPTHPAALHYQIHLVEASLHPEMALHSADVLKNTMPGVAHMVHMSSHMYQRNGLYAEGVGINEKAALLRLQYNSMAPNLEISTFELTHYEGVGSFCAMNANMYPAGEQFSTRLRDALSTTYKPRLSNTFFQYLYMMPMFVDIRSGKWAAIIAEPPPDSTLHYSALLDHFGRGLAYLGQHDTLSARRQLQQLRFLLNDNTLTVRNLPFNAPLSSAMIAEDILAGELALSEGKSDEAIEALQRAVSGEDRLIYREPKEWPIPARHFLGACLLQLKRAAEAEQIYRQDLIFNPGNGWSLLGLYQSLASQHKSTEAEKYKVEYTRAFSNADELPPASVY